jgi:hypothetical protein
VDPDTEVRKFALAALFTKHPELVTRYKNSEITDIVSHASTKTLDANLAKKAYNTTKAAYNISVEFAAKKARFLAQQQ